MKKLFGLLVGLLLTGVAVGQLQTPVAVQNLPNAGPLSSTDYIIDDQTPPNCPPGKTHCTNKATLAQLQAFIGGGGGGGGTFASLTSGTNTVASMLVGTGAVLAPTGSGVITATNLAVTPTQCTAGQFALGINIAGNAVCATPAGGGNVNTTGSPNASNLTQFSSSTTVTNGDLSGDCTTTGNLVTTCTKTNGVNFGTLATANAATPPAIGGTTPAAGAFTTLSASGTVSGSGFSTYLASPPAIGGTTPGAGTFSALTDTGITGLTQCLHVNSSGVISGVGSDCAAGTAAFNAISSGTNTTAAMVVSTGATLTPAGTGVITATGVPFSGVSTATNSTATLTVGTGGSITTSGTGTINANRVNAGTVPASAALLASNGSSQLTALTLGANLVSSGGVLGTSQSINAQTGTTYAMLTGDAGKLVTFSNAGAVAVSLSQATTTGFTAGYSFDVENLGVGNVTITPATSTINGAATLVIAQNKGCTVSSDGANYQVSACTAVAPGGSSAFSSLTSGTNTTAAMLVGSGASLSTTGTGSINANQINGATVPASVPLASNSSGQLIASGVTINAQTGTTYTVASTDARSLVTFSNAASVAVTLPQATGSFTTGFYFAAQNKGAGTVTITPTTSTINGSATLVVPTNTGCTISSDGTNYQVSGCTALGGALSSIATQTVLGNGSGSTAAPVALTLGANLVATASTLSVSQPTNAQTGTSYAVASGDAGKLVTLNNAAPVAVSIAQAGGAGFLTGYSVDLENIGAGVVTVTPTTSTINGLATLVMLQNQGCTLTSDGANYQVSACTAALGNNLTQAANTGMDGFTLVDSTVASTGNQQFSPRLRFTGQGWKTTATAASQPVDWIMENRPVQGTTAPTSIFAIASQVNGGGYSDKLTISSATTGVLVGSWNVTGVLQTTNVLASAGGFTVASGTGACATSSTTTGGSNAGSFVCTGTTGASTATLTLATSPHAYSCEARDVTTPTTITQTGAVSQTSVTFTITAVVTGDVIQWHCMAY